MKKSCVAACPVEWPDGRGISGRMRVEWVAGSAWNRWSDAHGMGGQMTVESAIITSAAKGYKIPQTRADINEFLERASGIVVPLLERVKKAREVYRLSSRGEYDIVTAANLTELAKLLTALEAFADD